MGIQQSYSPAKHTTFLGVGIIRLASVRIYAYAVVMICTEVESPLMHELDVNKMRALREAKGMKQTESAAEAGMSVSRWNDIEAGGRKNITIETLSIIARVLSVEPGELLMKAKGKKKG